MRSSSVLGVSECGAAGLDCGLELDWDRRDSDKSAVRRATSTTTTRRIESRETRDTRSQVVTS